MLTPAFCVQAAEAVVAPVVAPTTPNSPEPERHVGMTATTAAAAAAAAAAGATVGATVAAPLPSPEPALAPPTARSQSLSSSAQSSVADPSFSNAALKVGSPAAASPEARPHTRASVHGAC